MNQQPDKLFRDKLEGYGPTVSDEAWTRVAGNLGGKSNQRAWLKIAAGLLLLTAAGVLIFALEKSKPELIASEQSPVSRKDESTAKERVAPVQKQPVEKQESAIAPPPAAGRHEATPIGTKRETASSTAKKNPVTNDQPAETKKENVGQPEQVDEATLADNKQLAVNHTTQAKRVTLVFSAQEVNEKYLKKKNVVAEATTEVKETSTWQRLLDKANDLKHNQNPLGDLRQKKNEILALNFKNEKQSHENQ